jgi:hypothetical protein
MRMGMVRLVVVARLKKVLKVVGDEVHAHKQ